MTADVRADILWVDCKVVFSHLDLRQSGLFSKRMHREYRTTMKGDPVHGHRRKGVSLHFSAV